MSCHCGKAVRRRRSCPATRFGCWSWRTVRSSPSTGRWWAGASVPDEFVNLLADTAGREHIPGFAGRFSLHGHSAGAQFAARYLVTHPHRLDEAILSAPSTFPMPDPGIPWPNGMAAAARSEFGPRAAGWLEAATEVRVTVLVGSRDTQRRPPAPAQPDASLQVKIGRRLAGVAPLPPSAPTANYRAVVHAIA